MTSKISYIKLIREDIRHRGWLAALTGMVLFLGMPVYAMLYMDSYLGGDNPAVWTEYIQDVMPMMVNGYSVTYVAYAIVVLGALAALTGYAYIHSRERSDFYHSLPLKRGQWFVIRYFSGLIIFVIPYTAGCVLTVLAGVAYHIMTPEVFGNMAVAAGGGILAFLVIYNTCILAAVLTGQTVTGILAALVIAVYPTLLFAMVPMLKSIFFKTYTAAVSSLSDWLMEYASPAGVFYNAIRQTVSDTVSPASMIFIVLVIIILFTGAVLLYRVYPAEAAGRALSFSGTAPVFKVLICIPAALFCGIFINQFMGANGTKWLFILCFLMVVLLCAVVEFIYHQDLKMLLKGWRSSLICTGAVFAVLCVFRFDLLGYDTYIPAEEKVESMSVRTDSFSGYYDYPASLSDEYEELRAYGAFTDNTDSIYLLAKEGIENFKNGINVQNMHSGEVEGFDSEDYIGATFCYKLKSGRKVVRDYCVNREHLLSVLEELCKDDEYRQELFFPVFAIEEDSLLSISVKDSYGNSEEAEFKEEKDAFFEAYKKDLMETDIRTLADAAPIAEMWISVKDSYAGMSINGMPAAAVSDVAYTGGTEQEGITLGSQYIYEGFEHTLAYLEESGYTLRRGIDPEEVESIVIYLPDAAVESGILDTILPELSDDAQYMSYPDMDDELMIRSQEDIRIIADRLKAMNSGILGDNGTSMYAEVQFKDGYTFYGYVTE